MGLKAVISGGGIGGLATAAALGQRGWDVTVLESRPEIRVTGSGIYLHNNGVTLLKSLGAYDRVFRDPFWGKGLMQVDRNNEPILADEFAPGRVMVSVARSDLIAGLEKAARDAGAVIRTSAEVVDAKSDGSFKLLSGEEVQADLAIGADGVWSPVRRSLGLEQSRTRSAEGALRTIVKGTQDDIPPERRGYFLECWNGKRRALITPINSEEIYLAFCCPEVDVEARDRSIGKVWYDSFPQWAHLFERVEEASWGVYTVVKCKSWSAGRTCVVGDAAHATTPNLGQGGGMALQNGVALAAYMAKVSDPRDIPAALAAWEAEMYPRVSQCQDWAGYFGELANVPDDDRTPIFRAVLSNSYALSQLGKMASSEPIIETDWKPSGARA